VRPAYQAVWRSAPLEREVGIARWGEAGPPLLLFPTAGGDAREVERHGLVGELAPLVESGRMRIYSCDSVPGRALMTEQPTPEEFAALLYRFDVFVYHELLPFIRWECGEDGRAAEPVTAGASLGALFALIALCRHPDAFRGAVCLSGKYDLEDYFEDGEPPLDFHYASPLHFLPFLNDEDHLSLLRGRFVRLVCGLGRAERPEYSYRVARVLGEKGIPNRVDVRGPGHHHDWPTWRATLPLYLGELFPDAEERYGLVAARSPVASIGAAL
jgi:esterase/lipase superfamily enzyme